MSLHSSLDNTVLHATSGRLLVAMVSSVVKGDLSAASCLLLAITISIALILVVLHVELVSHILGVFSKTEEVEIIEFGDSFLEPVISSWPLVSWGRSSNIWLVAFGGDGIDGIGQVVGENGESLGEAM